ncbi:MAG: hypothetical protein ACHQLQ_01915 [Candidatus Acidiferrales bacterium]
MKTRRILRARAGVTLCGLGFWMALDAPHQHQTVLTDAESCRMAVDIVEPISVAPQGSVVLLHGLSANKKMMSYVAEGFFRRRTARVYCGPAGTWADGGTFFSGTGGSVRGRFC